MSSLSASLLAHCGVSAELARRLGLGDAVVESLLQTFDSEIERVRLHAYYTDRVVHRAGRLESGAADGRAHDGTPIADATLPTLGG